MEKKYREVNESDIGETVEISYAEFIHETKSWISACLHKILTKDERGQSFLVTVNGSWALARHARAELPLSYLNLHQASGLKVGDWVKITRAAKDREHGWDAVWSRHMDQYVGSIAQISLDFGDANCGFKIDGAGGWAYPALILQKVTHRPATEADLHKEVQWISDPDGKYWLVSIFQPKGCIHLRAVLEPMPGGGCKYTSYQFAFLHDVEIELQTAPQPPAEPASAPAPQRPAWLPDGFRVKARDEVIRPGDAVQANPSTEEPSGRWLFGIAGALEGKKVYQSRYPSDVWITPISEGQAHG